MHEHRLTRGFTLVELMVVVLVLGILVGVAAPKLGEISQVAGEEALHQQLRIVRDAMDRYFAEHNGLYPGATSDGTHAVGSEEAMLNQLLHYTNVQGRVSTSPHADFPFGPYLRSKPIVPLGPRKGGEQIDVVGNATPLAADTGGEWKYDYKTGEFILGYGGLSSDGATRYDEY